MQWNSSDNGYDVILHSQVTYDGLLMTCKANEESVPFSLFKVEPLGQRNVRVVIVQMYNPYVSNAAVAIFLGKYGKVDKPVKYLRTITVFGQVGDSSGFSSGRILRVGMAFDTLLPFFHSDGKGESSAGGLGLEGPRGRGSGKEGDRLVSGGTAIQGEKTFRQVTRPRNHALQEPPGSPLVEKVGKNPSQPSPDPNSLAFSDIWRLAAR
uniref:(Atlantic silverside) hypothetical protein n=1 Tax=Menidia menidia TaxID=238744 RepID=A0A8S4BMF1_9TELE|nr:unnamed protein product [Menidia menidia]